MFFTALLVATFFSVASAADFTAAENQFIQDLLSFRLSLRTSATSDGAIAAVQAYRTAHKELISTFSEEANLTCTNMLATAEYNCVYEKDMHSPKMEGILRPQYEKICDYRAKYNLTELNPWFIMTSADIINSMMQFLKRSDAISLGLQEKKDYAVVVEKNPQMSFALMLSGFWYYYAPGIGGGSKSKAKQFFSDALTYAANDYERYYGNINLSQIYFEEKNKNECERLLAEAEKILPATRYIAFIRNINALEYSLFDYNMNSTREKLDARLKGE